MQQHIINKKKNEQNWHDAKSWQWNDVVIIIIIIIIKEGKKEKTGKEVEVRFLRQSYKNVSISKMFVALKNAGQFEDATNHHYAAADSRVFYLASTDSRIHHTPT